jgi:hypothetical protein
LRYPKLLSSRIGYQLVTLGERANWQNDRRRDLPRYALNQTLNVCFPKLERPVWVVCGVEGQLFTTLLSATSGHLGVGRKLPVSGR